MYKKKLACVEAWERDRIEKVATLLHPSTLLESVYEKVINHAS